MLKKFFITIIILAIFIGVVIAKFTPHTTKIAHVVAGYIFHNEKKLKQTQDGHTNILLLGIGGGSHDGPNLTDTIIFASLDHIHKKITLFSIPRDLWVPDLQAKINTIYSDGEDKSKGQGLPTAESAIGKILGQPIHYGFRMNFDGFVKAVDEVGGLDIDVERTFDDYAYPVSGKEDETCSHTDQEIKDLTAQIATGSASETDSFPCRYKHIHFDKGQEHMDGQTALEYVRSRHAYGPEGSDFARSRRQAKVIAALKEKAFSVQTLLNPARITDLYTIVKDSIDTDFGEEEIGIFLKEVQDYKNSPIQSYVLDYGDISVGRPGLLINPPISSEYHNAWVLVPRTGGNDFSEVQKYIACQLTADNCIITKDNIGKISPTPTIIK